MTSKNPARAWIYSQAHLPTIHGNFEILVFRNGRDPVEHIALVKGDMGAGEGIPVRLHSECLTSEVLGSLKCDCREQLQTALAYLSQQEKGILLYLRQEGRGIGLGNKIKAYALQDQGLDTVEANHALGFPDDLRCYDMAAAMLKKLGVKSVYLLTNNPNKIAGLEAYGIRVLRRVPLQIAPHALNRFYLQTKSKKSGHVLDVSSDITKFSPIHEN